MWNAEWEYRNQETLKQWYDKQQGRGGVRKIICFGCGNVFYTQIESKKYCWNGTCGRLGNYKLQRQHRLEQRKDLVCRLRSDIRPQKVGCQVLQQCLPPTGI